MTTTPSLFTRGLPGGANDTGSPAEQRDDAKKNMLKAMRPLPTQHYWNVYFDRCAPTLLLPSQKGVAGAYLNQG